MDRRAKLKGATLSPTPPWLKTLGWKGKVRPGLARVVSEHKGGWFVATEHGEKLVGVRGRARLDGEIPAVGDWVIIDAGIVTEILERSSVLARETQKGPQILAVNVDVAFIMMGLDQDFNLLRLARFLAVVSQGGVDPVVVLNKADKHPDPEAAWRQVDAVANLADVITISALNDPDVSKVEEFLRPGETAVLLGTSGVGKSTLVNRLMGGSVQSTTEIREKDGRGRHTTTHRQLFKLPSGALLVDTPGLREIAPLDEGLEDAFDDIFELAAQCRWSNCRHAGDEDCAVEAAVKEGRLPAGRLEAFRRVLQPVGRRSRRAKA